MLTLCREHLRQGELLAHTHKEEAVNFFRAWAQTKVAAAEHMNIGSGPQIRQMLFAGASNEKPDKGELELERAFKVGLLTAAAVYNGVQLTLSLDLQHCSCGLRGQPVRCWQMMAGGVCLGSHAACLFV